MGPSSVWKLHIKRKLFVIGSQDRLKMGPTLGIFAPRARAPAMDFQEVIAAGGCEPRSGCELIQLLQK